MGWVRTKAITTELSAPPSMLLWLLTGVLMAIIGGMLFILRASGAVKVLSECNIWLLSLAPLGGWWVLFCLRGWLWGREVDEHQFLQKEADYAQTQWEEWAGRHLAILGTALLLPDGITAEAVLSSAVDKLPSRATLTRRISGVNEPMKDCLVGIQPALSALPSGLPLRVTIVTDLPVDEQVKKFTAIWLTLFPARLIPEDITATKSLSMNYVEKRLKQPVLTVDLILIVQAKGADEYSDAISAILMTSDDVTQKYKLSHSARLLRPMPLDVTVLEQDLALFLDTQTIATHTAQVYGDAKRWEGITAPLLTLGGERGAVWQSTEITMLERMMGIPGPAAPWLLTSLVAELVSLTPASYLTLCSSGDEHFICTITQGSEDEFIG
ncbi:type VI secretion protein [Enterobacter asburiae]|uniref:type VI secretion protein n=1 Tax=Enterobacter asburiae TaxID=61645 RepID=UPI001CC11290|nr:type VI secretion protein [Enterobacter asburiae]UAN16696.1 type VI secretion protein [Enterobacter asburiae]